MVCRQVEPAACCEAAGVPCHCRHAATDCQLVSNWGFAILLLGPHKYEGLQTDLCSSSRIRLYLMLQVRLPHTVAHQQYA
jgi:hypothetical protein